MKLETKEQYNTALARAERIFFANPGTPEGKELDALANAIEAYEEEHYPMSTPEDEALIERLETAWCEVTSDVPGPAARVKARGFLAMQREYERARGETEVDVVASDGFVVDGTDQASWMVEDEDTRPMTDENREPHVGEMTQHAETVSKDAYDGVLRELFAVADDLTTLRAERDRLAQGHEDIIRKYETMMGDPPEYLNFTEEQLKWVREAWYGAAQISRAALSGDEGDGDV